MKYDRLDVVFVYAHYCLRLLSTEEQTIRRTVAAGSVMLLDAPQLYISCADPGIFVRGVQVSLTKEAVTTGFFVCFFRFFQSSA